MVSQAANDEILSVFADAITDTRYGKMPFWIGLERENPHSDNWLWTNGEILGSYSNWGSNKPSSYYDCVRYQGSNWDDQNCGDDYTFGALCMRGDPVPSRKKRYTKTNNISTQRKQKFLTSGQRNNTLSRNRKKITQKKNINLVGNTSLANLDRSIIRRKKNVYYNYGVPRPKRNVDNLVTREINCVSIWDGIAGVWSYPYTVPEYCFSKV